MDFMRYIAGDIGGTHTRLAIFDGKSVVKEKKYLSQKFSHLEEILQDFLTEKVEAGCFAIAGPILQRQCKATNLPWIVDAEKLSQKFKINQLFLINDLEAAAWGVSVLKDSQLLTLNEGKKQKGNQAVIAAGTGLGEAGIFWDGESYHPFACEGGHANFAPCNEKEDKLLHSLRQKYGHVSYERLLSGAGIEHLYEQLSGKQDSQAFSITEKALDGSSKICSQTLDWFVSIYGSEAGNLALKFLALGGVYIAGGIAPKIASILQNGLFMKAFCDKGRFEPLLSTIAVKVVLTDDVALFGALNYTERHIF